jgi:hypothetical protein
VSKYYGPKLNRDWIGLRVKLKHRATNAMATLAAGTSGIVEGYSNTGIYFESDPCEHCQVKIRVSQMRRHDFEILTPEEEWPNTQGQGRKKQHRMW